jgi:hypothetical protein
VGAKDVEHVSAGFGGEFRRRRGSGASGAAFPVAPAAARAGGPAGMCVCARRCVACIVRPAGCPAARGAHMRARSAATPSTPAAVERRRMQLAWVTAGSALLQGQLWRTQSCDQGCDI